MTWQCERGGRHADSERNYGCDCMADPEPTCRYSDCPEGHPVGGEDDVPTCETCRRDVGLDPIDPEAYDTLGDVAALITQWQDQGETARLGIALVGARWQVTIEGHTGVPYVVAHDSSLEQALGKAVEEWERG